ncbi:ulp1 protease family, C-terminal catalytic domain-containing protein [Tanacetum coccineum]
MQVQSLSFKNKDLQVQLGIFESLFPDVEVAAGIIDIWSLVLNHEEKYREKNSGGGNIYCYSGMLLPYESFHDVDLVFFPMITTKRSHHFYLICFNMKTAEIDIIDNLDNDIEDISVRYGELPIYLIHTFLDYLGRINHPKFLNFKMNRQKIIKMDWRSIYNCIDCGIFVMRHMETYVGRGIFWKEFKKEGQGQELQLRILRIKYLTKIIMLSINERRGKVMKEADEYTKTQTKSSRIIKDENLIVSDNLLETIRVRVSKILDVEKSKI